MSSKQNPSGNAPRHGTGIQSASWVQPHTVRKMEENYEQGVSSRKLAGQESGKSSRSENRDVSRSLLQSKDYRSFNRKVEETLNTVCRDKKIEGGVTDTIILMEKNMKETTKKLDSIGTEYIRETIWKDIKYHLNLLKDVWTRMKEATHELRIYVAMDFGRQFMDDVPSLESLNEDSTLFGGREACARALSAMIQEAYDIFQSSFNQVLQRIGFAFRQESRSVEATSVDGICTVAHAVRLLGLFSEIERQLRSVKEEQYRMVMDERLVRLRKECIIKVLEEKCRHIEELQKAFFQPKHLYAKGKASIAKLKSMAETIRKCWKESSILIRNLRKSHPAFKENAMMLFGQVIYGAAALIAEMQDSPDIQAFVLESEPIHYDDEVICDIVRAQLWLLPCLQDLLQIASHFSKRIRRISLPSGSDRGSGSKAGAHETPQIILDLKQAVYNVVMMAIVRSSWLISWTSHSFQPRLDDLEEQGSQSLMLVFVYNNGDLSLRCSAESPKEDMKLYVNFVYSTNMLRNGVLQVHSMLQKERDFADAIGVQSTELSQDEEDDTDMIYFHRVKELAGIIHQPSIRGFPISLDSQDYEFDIIKQEVANTIETATGTREAEHPTHRTGSLSTKSSKEQELTTTQDPKNQEIDVSTRQNSQLRQCSSGDSFNLYSGFGAIESSESSIEGQKTSNPHSKFGGMICSIPSTDLNSGPSRPSPFQTQTHSKTLPISCSNNASTIPGFSQDLDHVEDGVSSSTAMMRSLSLHSSDRSDASGQSWKEDFGPCEFIGQGAAGSVLRTTYHSTPVAVKIMNDSTRQTQERFRQETQLHSKLSGHPNIVQFVKTVEKQQAMNNGEKKTFAMIMELCELGSLFKIIKEAKWIEDKKNFGSEISEYNDAPGFVLYNDWLLRIQLGCDIAAGMAHIHEEGFVHRDLTSYNIVVKKNKSGNDEWIGKVCDFERSREIPEIGYIPRSDTFANSPAWAAPEIVDNANYSQQADVYSMGIILWELITLDDPNELYGQHFRFSGTGSHAEKRKQLMERISKGEDTNFPEFPQLVGAMKHCLSLKEEDRPTMLDLHFALVEIKKALVKRREGV